MEHKPGTGTLLLELSVATVPATVRPSWLHGEASQTPRPELRMLQQRGDTVVENVREPALELLTPTSCCVS